jgi:hypothetical protein
MWVLSFLATFQAASYGPTPNPPARDAHCDNPASGEIIVCKRHGAVSDQRLPPLPARPPDALGRDELGLFHRKLGKADLSGGGSKASVGLSLRLPF